MLRLRQGRGDRFRGVRAQAHLRGHQRGAELRRGLNGLEDLRPTRRISTLAPLAGSDGARRRQREHRPISTLAPLAGSDMRCTGALELIRHFNPRSPCGERLAWLMLSSVGSSISTLAPLAGSDQRAYLLPCHFANDFNPRSPCGERRFATPRRPPSSNFNPRSPCGERRGGSSRSRSGSDFNPRSPCGERPSSRALW